MTIVYQADHLTCYYIKPNNGNVVSYRYRTANLLISTFSNLKEIAECLRRGKKRTVYQIFWKTKTSINRIINYQCQIINDWTSRNETKSQKGKFEKIKRLISSRNRRKMDKRQSTIGQTMIIQSITQQTKDPATRIPLKTGVLLRFSGRVSTSCFTCDIRRITLIINPVSHK